MGPMTPLMGLMETNQPTALVQVGAKSHKSKIKQHTVVDLSTRPVVSKLKLIRNSNGRHEWLNLVQVSKRGLQNAKDSHKWAQ